MQRKFDVAVKKKDGKVVVYEKMSGLYALKLMKKMDARALTTEAKTQANGITELLTLGEMVDIFEGFSESLETV